MPLEVETYPNARFVSGVHVDYNELRYGCVPEFKVNGQLLDEQIKEVLVPDVDNGSLKYDMSGIISIDKLNTEGNAIFGKVEPDLNFATTNDLNECYWDSGFMPTPSVGSNSYQLVIPEGTPNVGDDITYGITHAVFDSGGDPLLYEVRQNLFGDFEEIEGGIILPQGDWIIEASCFPQRFRYSNNVTDQMKPSVESPKINLFGIDIEKQRAIVNINKRVEYKFGQFGRMLITMRRIGV